MSLPATKKKGKYKSKDYVPSLPFPILHSLTEEILAKRRFKSSVRVAQEFAEDLDDQRGTWGWAIKRMVVGLLHDKPGYRIFSKGNSKLPFYSFSTSPIFTCPGAGDCTKWCYSLTSWRHPVAWARQVQNTLLLRYRKRIVSRAFSLIPHDTIFRLYVDGDFESEAALRFWFKELQKRPDIQAYGYSKSWDLIWAYAQSNKVPENYKLNLSSGAVSSISREEMKSLPFVRGDFLAIPVNYRPENHKGKVGFERYDDPAYHQLVRERAAQAGLGRVFSCPGRCGECAGGKHACGNEKFQGITIVIGIH